MNIHIYIYIASIFEGDIYIYIYINVLAANSKQHSVTGMI